MGEKFLDQIHEIERKSDKLYVKFIRLGEMGARAEECIQNRLLYISYDTDREEVRSFCNNARKKNLREQEFQNIKNYWIYERKKTPQIATNFTNSVLSVSEDSGDVLWFTVHKRLIFYGLTSGGELERYEAWRNNKSNNGSMKKMKYGWFSKDRNGQQLRLDTLSGALTKTQGSRGTISSIQKDVSQYFINTILCKNLNLKTNAKRAKNELQTALIQIIKDLQPSEFETLIDLIFSNSGWKRDGELGGNMKFIDVSMILPSTGERAGAQVKTKTSKAEIQKYLSEAPGHGFDKFFFIYHTGPDLKSLHRSEDSHYIWDISAVAEKAIDAGLSKWIIDRAYR